MTGFNLGARATAIALLCVAVPATSSYAQAPARNDKVPVLDMRPGCQAVSSQDLDLADKPTEQSCLNEEQAARQKLVGLWSTFSASDRHQCVTGNQIGGAPSYINLLWCLQDAKTAHEFEQKPDTEITPSSGMGSLAADR